MVPKKKIPEIDFERVDVLIKLALQEDLDGAGDVTTLSVVPESAAATAFFICKEEKMVIAGLEAAERVFRLIDADIKFVMLKKDGEICCRGEKFAEVSGLARSILTGERTALNFLQRLCGVATTSARYAAELAGSKTVILDTRKTTPGFRNLEKYAVAVGGGSNHRIGLFDRVMIKDNHREMAAMEGAGGIARSVARARAMFPELEIEVEVDNLDELREAVETGAEYILLDNMSDEAMKEAVVINAGRARLEASGNVTIERLKNIAATGVDFVSSGALTHSVRSADISLDIEASK